MLKRLHLTKNDTIILDREDDGNILINGQLIFEHHNPAKLVIVVHADHYDDHYTNKKNVLWNNFYEYQFTHTKDVASFIVVIKCKLPRTLNTIQHQTELRALFGTKCCLKRKLMFK